MVNDITKVFGGLIAVNKVSLDVAERSIHSIIGPNGAGKTTFFNILSGFYYPQNGSILFKGRELVGMKPDEICRLGMARTFQKIRLFSTMTALDNVMLGLRLRNARQLSGGNHCTAPGWSKKKKPRGRTPWNCCNFVGLSDKRYNFANSLSYGDQRRLEIARALATGLQLLLLDEPTAGMSPEETQDVIELIQVLRARYGTDRNFDRA